MLDREPTGREFDEWLEGNVVTDQHRADLADLQAKVRLMSYPEIYSLGLDLAAHKAALDEWFQQEAERLGPEGGDGTLAPEIARALAGHWALRHACLVLADDLKRRRSLN